MQIEEFFNQRNVVDLSFFNFRNAITAAYFANKELEILTVNDNFKSFFPVLGNVSNAYFPDVLEQLNVPGVQIDQFVTGLQDDGRVLIPEIHVKINGDTKVFSLLSTYTKDESFSYLNGVQGQFVDRTAEWELRQERESLLDQKLRDQQIIEEKSKQLENLATRLAKYLSPQIYETIFSSESEVKQSQSRKNLTVFFSDIERFTDISDVLEPEKLAFLINSYLSEMATIAIDCGGTIDKLSTSSLAMRCWYFLATRTALVRRKMRYAAPTWRSKCVTRCKSCNPTGARMESRTKSGFAWALPLVIVPLATLAPTSGWTTRSSAVR
jgi:hypothetical protein